MRKRVVIEALALRHKPCGLREFTGQVCLRLARHSHPSVALTFIVPPRMSGCFGNDVDYIEAGPVKARMLRRLPLVKADLFHALHQLCLVKNLPGARNKLLTIHDINFAHTRKGRRYKAAEARFLYRLGHATHLSFISSYARDDVAAHFPNRLPSRVIYNGVTRPDIADARPPQTLSGMTRPFLLHLSSLVPYKNPHLLVEMMDSLPDRTLVIAGQNHNAALEQMAAKRGNVIMAGPVNDRERAWLYANCEAFLFPSMAEGFGLPPLEAMLAGKPVFLSNLTSLPEIGGNAAFYWNDLTPSVMARELQEAMANPPSADVMRLQARQFSWDLAADMYFQYYLDILNTQR